MIIHDAQTDRNPPSKWTQKAKAHHKKETRLLPAIFHKGNGPFAFFSQGSCVIGDGSVCFRVVSGYVGSLPDILRSKIYW